MRQIPKVLPALEKWNSEPQLKSGDDNDGGSDGEGPSADAAQLAVHTPNTAPPQTDGPRPDPDGQPVEKEMV